MTKKKTLPKKRSNLIDDLKVFRERLGPLADDYTPSELRKLRDDMKALADIVIDLLLNEQKLPPEGTIEY